jgi:hypothetical protein
MFGLKFDFGSSKPTYTLVTARIPIWGNWYAKDGNAGGGFNSAWNASFTTPPTAGASPFTGWIPTPDSESVVVPLPAAAWMGMALIGSIGGAGFIRRRKVTAI